MKKINTTTCRFCIVLKANSKALKTKKNLNKKFRNNKEKYLYR